MGTAEKTLAHQVGALAAAERRAGIRVEDFEPIVREHQRRIYRLLLALLRDPDAADTLTQECFLRAFEKRASFRGQASVATWLARIAVNLARDHRRNRRQAFWRRLLGGTQDRTATEPAIQKVADPGKSPERTLAAREEVAVVWAAVEELSPQQRAVFVLRFAEEMTLVEIAQTMRLELGTVKAHLHRAVGAVRRKMKERNRGSKHAVHTGRHDEG